ncbi:CmeU family protein [Campylobacter suis]|uniref:Chain-length determining protein n=1 Tax=Campylobacter suis TaxID=2790657 RepID=A0ABN7K9B1_9BACT|nr:CmeU family protein [Campylobacter suis]CAD7289113.1 hypothetical protein LMG8286_01654 [Campylobacter suis]
MDKKEEIAKKIEEIFKARAEFFKLLDTNIPKKNGTDVFDFDSAKEINAREVYQKFYALDYSVRRLLPDVYKAYDVSFNV